MRAISISEFAGNVRRWMRNLDETRQPIQVTVDGKPRLVVFDSATFQKFVKTYRANLQKLNALEIKALVERGEKDLRQGKYLTHEQVGRELGLVRPKEKYRHR